MTYGYKVPKLSAKEKEKIAQEQLDWLRKLLKPGSEVYAKVTSVARGGMSRRMNFYIPVKKNGKLKIYDISWAIAKALGYRVDRDTHEVTVGGCGMDMCFHMVYSLGAALWPEGTKKPHGSRNGEPDSDGGYALKKVQL